MKKFSEIFLGAVFGIVLCLIIKYYCNDIYSSSDISIVDRIEINSNIDNNNIVGTLYNNSYINFDKVEIEFTLYEEDSIVDTVNMNFYDVVPFHNIDFKIFLSYDKFDNYDYNILYKMKGEE